MHSIIVQSLHSEFHYIAGRSPVFTEYVQFIRRRLCLQPGSIPSCPDHSALLPMFFLPKRAVLANIAGEAMKYDTASIKIISSVKL